MLGFWAEANPRREPISNVSNLRKGPCHRSYTLWKNGLNSLSFDSQSLESGSIEREKKGGLLIHAFVPTIHFPSLVFFSIFLSFLSKFFVYAFVFYFLFSFYLPSVLFFASSLTVHGYPFIYRLLLYDLPLLSLQDCPPACQLSNHYLCSGCVSCTTLHFQTKLLVLFLTSLCSYFTHMDKD